MKIFNLYYWNFSKLFDFYKKQCYTNNSLNMKSDRLNSTGMCVETHIFFLCSKKSRAGRELL